MRNKNIIFQLMIVHLITANASGWLYFPRYSVLQVSSGDLNHLNRNWSRIEVISALGDDGYSYAVRASHL